MLEISPVLAGTFDSPNYTPSVNNLGSSQIDDANGVDSRRYTQFDHSATEAGTADLSFSDFLDMINPLEHIPVISSIYREITDEKINPVSRVVGDLIYGGITGIATGVIGVVGAIGDSVMEASNGKDAAGTIVASLFGPDQKTDSTNSTTQLAVATPSPASSPVVPSSSALSSPASSTVASMLATPAATAAMTPAAAALASIASMSPTNSGPTLAPNADAQSQALLAAKAFPLDPKKLPYGGVMDPGPLQGSNMALSMATSAPGIQMNHMVYPGGLVRGAKPSALAAASSAPPANAQPTSTASASAIPGAALANPLPPELMQDIASLRAINQYKNTAIQTAPIAGGNVDVVN